MPRPLRPLLLAFLLLAADPAQAVILVFQNGVGGYAGADNQSYSFDGLQSFDTLYFDYPSFGQPEGRYAWLLFGGLIGPDAIPPGATIRRARVEGWVQNPFGSATITRLLDDIANRPPWIHTVPGTFYDDTQAVSAAHGDSCQSFDVCEPPLPIAWDVTASVQSWADGAPNHGFLILPETTDGGALHPTDDPSTTLRPRLVVTAVPEPGGALGACAVLALAALRSRAPR